jgi:hypothetical protein
MATTAPLAAAVPAAVDYFPFAALPPVLAHKIFAAVPADTRLRCAEVCKAWCAAVAERSLWTRLDLSWTSGVTYEVTDSLLRAAAAKARGALTALDVSGLWQVCDDGVLREVLAANAGTLRELRCLTAAPAWVAVPRLEALLSAAPQLRVCEADVVITDIDEARRALRNEGVFGPLHVQALQLHNDYAPLLDDYAPLLVSLFADMAAHASLTELYVLAPLDDPEVFGAFVDAALSLPLLRAVTLQRCHLSPASAPALARLLGSSTLLSLVIDHIGSALLLFDAPAAWLLGDALLANTTLTALVLHGTRMWRDHAAAAALLGALTGHASVRRLALVGEWRLSEEERLHAGALLGALVAADAPALTALDVLDNYLSDDGLRPLFEALPGNSHLRTLHCSHTDMSDAFSPDVLLPAVRANTSLRSLLVCGQVERQLDAAREAEALVARRRQDTAAD